MVITGITGTTDNEFYLGYKQDGYKNIYAYDSDINNPGIRWNDNDNQWEFSNNGIIWKSIEQNIPIPLLETSGGTGQITYTTGDLLYSDGSNSLNKLAIGSSSKILKVSGGLPSWQDLTGTLVETDIENIAGGTGALVNITNGDYNTAFGYNAGNSITTSNNNVLLGTYAGKSIIGDGYNIITGGDNVATNYNGQYSIIISSKNTGGTLTSQNHNILIGTFVGQNLSGEGNVLVGCYCGENLSSLSNYNTGLGQNAMGWSYSVSNSISYCVAIGHQAFRHVTTAEKSIAVGYQSGYVGTSNIEQIMMGYSSGYQGCGDYSIVIGSYSGGGVGSESVVVGKRAKFKTFNKAVALGPYSENAHHYSLVISGYGTIGSPTKSNGEYTATLGYHSLYLGKRIPEDVTIYANNGAANLSYLKYSNTSNSWAYSNDGITERNFGDYNTDHNIINNLQGGEYDGYYHLTEEEHTWVTDGYYSLRSGNVFIGESADGYQIDVENGIAIGKSASVGDRSIAIGYQATANGIDRIAIGYGSTPTLDNTCYIGDPIVNPIDLSAASYANYSDIRMKKNIKPLKYGLEIIKSLNPVEFYYDTEIGSDYYKKKNLGLIAQEVEKVSGIIEDWGVVLQDSDCWKLDYIQLISLSIKAVQQLSNKVKEQQKQIEKRMMNIKINKKQI